MASNFLIAMKVVLETLAYTSFIFIAMLVMLPSGLVILGKYFGLLMWLQLWAPLYAVLNLVMAIAARHQSQGILGEAGLTMLTSVGLANLHADIEAIAAMASASIPFISYAITQGGVGPFMHLAGSLTSSLQGAASQSAAEISSGNVSLGNVSYAGRQQYMTSGFKHDTSFAFKSGRMEMERLDGATNFMTPAGRLGLGAGAGINTSTWQDNISISLAIGQNITGNISRSQSELESLSHSYQNQQNVAFNQSTSLLKSAMQNVGQQQGFAISGNSQYRESFSKALSFAEDLQKNEGYNETQIASIMSGLGMKMPQGMIANVEVQTGFSDQASYYNAVQKARNAAQNRGVLSSIEEGISHMSDLRFTGAKGDEQRLADNLGATLNKMEGISDQISVQRGKVKQWQDAKSYFENNSLSSNQDVREELIDHIASKRRLQDGKPLGRAEALQMIASRTLEYQKYLDEFTYSKASNVAAQFAARTAPASPTPTDDQTKIPEQDLFKFSVGGMNLQHQQEKGKESYNVNIEKELANLGGEDTFKGEKEKVFKENLEKGWKNKGLKYGVERVDEDGNVSIDYIPLKSLEDYQKHFEQKHNILPVEEKQKDKQLAISPDLTSAEAKYRKYGEPGKPARDIVNEVNAQSAKHQGQLKQQVEATSQRRESIEKAYEAEASTSRPTKALIGIADYVDGFAGDLVKFIGVDYTTEKEKREASYRAGETTAFAELETPQRLPSAPVVGVKLLDKEDKEARSASVSENGASDAQVVSPSVSQHQYVNQNAEEKNRLFGLSAVQQLILPVDSGRVNAAPHQADIEKKEILNDNSWSFVQMPEVKQSVSNDIVAEAGAKQITPVSDTISNNDNLVIPEGRAAEKQVSGSDVWAESPDKPVTTDNNLGALQRKPQVNQLVEADTEGSMSPGLGNAPQIQSNTNQAVISGADNAKTIQNVQKEEVTALISEHLSAPKPQVIKVQNEKFDSSIGMRTNNGEQEQIKKMLREQGQITEDVKREDNDA